MNLYKCPMMMPHDDAPCSKRLHKCHYGLMACSTMSTNSPHDQLCTYKSCSIPKYTVVWGPRWYHIYISRTKIRSAQNVGEVWISPEKNFPAPFGAIPGHFLHEPTKIPKHTKFAYLPWRGPCCYPPLVFSFAVGS